MDRVSVEPVENCYSDRQLGKACPKVSSVVYPSEVHALNLNDVRNTRNTSGDNDPVLIGCA